MSQFRQCLYRLASLGGLLVSTYFFYIIYTYIYTISTYGRQTNQESSTVIFIDSLSSVFPLHILGNNNRQGDNLPCDLTGVYPGTPSKCTCSLFDIFIPIRMDPSSEPSVSPAPSADPTSPPSISYMPSGEPSSTPTTSMVPTRTPVTDSPTFTPSGSPIYPTSRPSMEPSCVLLNTFECIAFTEDDTINYSVIIKEDTDNAAKNVYKNMYVGGTLSNPSQSTVTVGGHVYYGSITEPINMNFNGGKSKLSDLSESPLDFEYYEWLATHITAGSYSDGYDVIIETQPKTDGSCYTMHDFLGSSAQGANNGKTLVVFTFDSDICLTKTSDGRQFGPSVLAPFSKVTLTDAGYLDGVVIAKSFTTVTGGLYYTVCGSSGSSTCAGKTLEAAIHEQHEVRCCSDTNLGSGWNQHTNCINAGYTSVWGETDINGVCHSSKTFDEAVAICANVGARLCSKEELLADCSRGK